MISYRALMPAAAPGAHSGGPSVRFWNRKIHATRASA